MPLQYSGGYATADHDEVEDQRQPHFLRFTAARACRPPENTLDEIGS
jgi:hypothetical protein